MGHRIAPDKAYRLLRDRLDENVTGAPDSPEFRKILHLLFQPEEADLARRLPTRPLRLEKLAERLGLEPGPLADRLSRLAERGLVFDLEKDGRRYFALAPVVIGFFELTFMRTREDVPQAELARLFEEYFFQGDGRFARAVFGGETQLGRSLVRETALPQGDFAEVLDWERATRIVETASARAVSFCACRHHAAHLGRACDRPMRACLSFGPGAETLVAHGHAERASRKEALAVLAEAQKAGLAQTADNVKQGVGYICNCCGCCCGMMRAIRTHGIRHAIVSSSWIAEVVDERCSGCGLCVDACPSGAMAKAELPVPGGKPKKTVVREADLCLGCGVCHAACHRDAIRMAPRPARVFTPETTFERVVGMAIERGKLAPLLLEDPESLTAQALGRVVQLLEAAGPLKAALAIRPLRSLFFESLLPRLRGRAGDPVLPSA